MSGKVLEIGAIEETKKPSPFRYDGNRLQTPILDVHFDKQGYITSLIDLANQRELRGQGIPLNSFLLGEDVPVFWDNWDIDADQYLKMQVQENLVERHVSADGPLQFRLRSEYRIGLHSRLWQDMIFHTDSPRIDFETRVEWREKHQLLKVGFDLNLLISSARHEIQYGHLERPTHQNTSYDRARFEVCQHKWTDLSENRYGIALLNDCKYGVSVLKSDLRLTLLKGGCHPDPRGDEGTHDFTYSLLPHQGAFGAETVIRPAYELNVPVLAFPGKTQLPTTSLLQINSTNIILEAIKIAEDESALIFRFYESERSATRARISFGFPCEEVQLTNLLEEKLESVPVIDKSIELEFRAFEIKTVKVFIPRHHC